MKSITSKSSCRIWEEPLTTDKDKVALMVSNCLYYDGSDQDSLARTFGDGGYSLARLYPATSSYSSIAEKYKDNIFHDRGRSGGRSNQL